MWIYSDNRPRPQDNTCYLSNPAWFPEADALCQLDESASLILEFARTHFVFSGLPADDQAAVRSRFDQLIVESSSEFSTCCPTHCQRIDAQHFKVIDLAGWHLSFDLKTSVNSVRIVAHNFIAEFPLETRAQANLWIAEGADLVADGILENYFRTRLAYVLLQAGGLLLHSAAVIGPDGLARVLFGHSGAGKSTISHLCSEAGWEILSDDMNALIPAHAGVVVQQLPFAGDFGQTAVADRSVPVAGLYLLQQRHHNAIHKITSARLMAAMLACAPFTNQDALMASRLLKICTQISGSVKNGQAEFSLSGGIEKLLLTDCA